MRSYIFAPPDRGYWVAVTSDPDDPEHVWYDSPAVTAPFCIARETADKIILALLEQDYERVP
jgi:hypothetical protein